jgi:FSR family fosmidomycin resistance protein-like MFS transporter
MLPKWLAREVGTELTGGLTGIGMLVGAIYLVGAAAQLLGGYLADRGLCKATYVASFALKLAALALAYGVTGWPVVLAAMIIVLVFDIAAPIENVLIARYSPERRRGLAYGVRHGIAVVSAPLGVQLVASLYSESTGFADLLLVTGGLVAVILFAALFLPADRGARAEAQGPPAEQVVPPSAETLARTAGPGPAPAT